MKYHLKKIVPKREITLEIEAVNPSFTKMSEKFRAVRSRSRNKMDKCHWCGHPFENGEMMALAFLATGNKALCQACAQQAIASCPEEA